jgi:hypothetical protein
MRMKRLLSGIAAAAACCMTAAGAAMAMPKGEPLSQKESFMLMFGKGNGAMRVLCALQKEGVIDQATRQLWVNKLEHLLSESADSAVDRRNTRIGMAFADARGQLCPTRIMGRSDP